MKPTESPFPPHWVGTDLTNVGLDDQRPRVGTYGTYNFEALPSLPLDIRGDFAWLATADAHEQCIGDEKTAENAAALLVLQNDLARLGLHLPAPFLRFMRDRSLQERVRSNTDCFLDLCPQPVRSPIGDGYLIRFLADSQGCVFWYLYLTLDGSDHAVVTSPDFYGTDEEQWQDEPPDASQILYVAESFETFVCRFWLENEIWFSEWEQTPMPDVGRVYIERYRERAR